MSSPSTPTPDIDKPLPNDTPNVTLTIRMIMSGKEVGSIIGKGGEIINSIREESGAKIHISDGSVPERIVTVTGSTDAILKSFTLISKKFEEEGPEKNGNYFPYQFFDGQIEILVYDPSLTGTINEVFNRFY